MSFALSPKRSSRFEMTTPARPANLSAEGAASLATVTQPLQPTVEVAQQVRRAENEAPPSTALEPVVKLKLYLLALRRRIRLKSLIQLGVLAARII